MSLLIDVTVPALGESITEATVLEWLVAPGQSVTADQELVALETDKITVNVPAPAAGVLAEVVAEVGAEVEVGSVVARIDRGGAAAGSSPPPPIAEATAPAPVPPTTAAPKRVSAPPPQAAPAADLPPMMPAVRRLVAEHGLDPHAIRATGRGGRLLKGDVLAHLSGGDGGTTPAGPAAARAAAAAPAQVPPAAPAPAPTAAGRERVVPMSRLRRRIAENLVSAQQNAAMLTTFNEVDMSAVMALRSTYKQAFLDRYGIKLGFTSFFAKAAVEALKQIPAVNAEVRGDHIIYKDHYDIGVAVGGGRGLVVPVVRDADRLGFAQFEQALADLASRARDNKLTLADLQGGTFTISNGGVYGSLLSTPILNPPQSGILGLHKIERRPIAVGDQVVVRPMMYLALTYDHRIVDGREAVTFLVRIKQLIEDPNRLLIEV